MIYAFYQTKNKKIELWYTRIPSHTLLLSSHRYLNQFVSHILQQIP